MNSFVSAVQNQSARTENGMRARKSTANACVDLFFKIGASRGKDITKDFAAAYAEDSETALRIAAWARDARGGAGERQLFRDILKYLEKINTNDALRLVAKAPELGRWDDVLGATSPAVKQASFEMVKNALAEGNGLAAKWMPRKGDVAVECVEHQGGGNANGGQAAANDCKAFVTGFHGCSSVSARDSRRRLRKACL